MKLVQQAIEWESPEMCHVATVKFGPPVVESEGEKWIGVTISITSQVREEELEWVWEKVWENRPVRS